MLTYSDLITLLMIFFVIMYAMSKVDQVKFVALEQSLATALHQSDKIPLNLGTSALVTAANPTDTGKRSTVNQASLAAQQDKVLDRLYQQLALYIRQHHLENNVEILNQARGVQITLRDVVLFDTGQAVIKPAARKILDGLVPFLRQVNNPIVIEGYTDNQPIHTAKFPSNWELSGARAIGVVRYLIARGVAPSRLSGVGYGQYHGVAPNDTPAHRQMNRRINIVILREPPLNWTIGLPPNYSAAAAAGTGGSAAAPAGGVK
ncbi:MAG: OmpA family protein [Alicyclobacillaceae bacterium]|nr:OmpA family protein [Alicyclobacillaceae bacterium]